MPTFPNEAARGLLTGQSIRISQKQNNVMADLNLEGHFLQKLEQLRVMKEEYYQLPKRPDAEQILKGLSSKKSIVVVPTSRDYNSDN